MIDIRPPVADDFRRLRPQASEAEFAERYVMLADECAALCLPSAKTYLVDGEVKIISGFLPDGEAWACFCETVGFHLAPITRHVRAELEEFSLRGVTPWARIDPKHPQAVRWAQMLGFVPNLGEVWVYDPTRS